MERSCGASSQSTHWMRSNKVYAQPAIAALEDWRSFTAAIRKATRAARLSTRSMARAAQRRLSRPVVRDPACRSYRLTCGGATWFSHCVYDSSTRAWTRLE